MPLLAGGHAVRGYVRGKLMPAAGDLVDGRVVDAVAVVVAQVVVVVALVLTAELDQVVALDLGDIVREHLVLAVPEALAHVLRVHVVRISASGRLSPPISTAPPRPGSCGGAGAVPHCQKLRR